MSFLIDISSEKLVRFPDIFKIREAGTCGSSVNFVSFFKNVLCKWNATEVLFQASSHILTATGLKLFERLVTPFWNQRWVGKVHIPISRRKSTYQSLQKELKPLQIN